MNHNEKICLLEKCKKHYQEALRLCEKKPCEAWLELGKAKALKEVIEEFIDCQPTKYYCIYNQIVLLSLKFIR